MSTKNAVVVAVVLCMTLLTAPVALAVENGADLAGSAVVSAPAKVASTTSEAAGPSFSDLLLGFISSVLSPAGGNAGGEIGLAPRPEDRGPSIDPTRV